MTATIDREEIEAFLFLEARLQDESRYREWEELWTDSRDALYWVPAGADDIDPAQKLSYIYDNRTRISSRVRQLETGARYSQVPPSRMRRVISNIEYEVEDPSSVRVSSNFLLVEHRIETRIWAGRTIHRLRKEDGKLVMVEKKVLLVNNDAPLPTMSFLI